ncbi:hypothetical protein FOC4_g10003760 [Fusarium odoratissimum]|uniref:Peptidase A1 domain-containing protein n=1 Tax=Fusarium oxysporum f. sp. cubense (strain race 4) TaxID=2502994 RepID=N1S5U0_FUSC4|nr:hypothetical protein FOC4_g10003760 [Fusarium odoratissimum]
MRFSHVCSIALVANAAMASVCKPRSRATSIALAESRATMIFTETHTVDTTNTATVDVSANTATSTVADATTAESTITSDLTASVSAPEPFETFDVLAIGGSINGQYMKGVANEGSMMGWDLIGTGTGHMPPFTGYGDGSEPNFVASCELFTSADTSTGFLTCEQTTDRKLKCFVPGIQCVFEPDTVCTLTGGDFDHFYSYSGRTDGLWLAIDSGSKSDFW